MSKIWILTSAPEPLSERLRELGHDPRPADWETIRSHSPVEADLILAELPEQGDLPTLALPYPPVLLLAPPPASADRALEQVGNVAFDVLPPLSEPKSFARQLERGLQYAKLLRENHSLRQSIRREQGVGELVGQSQTMTSLFELIGRISHATACVLLTGERGTGKEVVAREIHRRGPRSHQPFVALNCGALPPEFLESELFGHVAGAFPGALRDKPGLLSQSQGGTLFLDEVGKLTAPLQAKLLHLIQEKQFQPMGDTRFYPADIRVLAANQADLRDSLREGTFREDLFYRLNVISIHLPPLRERPEDIAVMADYFLRRFAQTHRKGLLGFTDRAREKLLSMPWPGNVRELESVVERSVVLVGGEWVDEADIANPEIADPEAFFDQVTTNFPTLEQLEKRYIRLVLDKTGGRKDKAAGILGINRRTLYRKEREYGWEPVPEAKQPSVSE